MDMRKTTIDHKMYDICTLEDYLKNPNMYTPSMTAIEIGEMVYPMRSKYDPRPGIYVGEVVSMINEPTVGIDEYKVSNIRANFNNLNDIRDAMQTQQMVKDMENEILTTPDNLTKPTIDQEDAPVMIALKTAINKKNIDIDKYASRFGPNFNNDKRLLNKHSISLSKLETMIDNLDIKGTLILEDKSPDVPNPIGERIIVDLKGANEDE